MKFEVTEQLKNKCLAQAISYCMRENDCTDMPVVIDDVGFCYDGEIIFAVVAEPVEEFDDSIERKRRLRTKIEKALPEYILKSDNLGKIVMVDSQIQILSEHRASLRMQYGF